MLPPRVARLFRLAVSRDSIRAREIEDEIESHLEERTSQLVAARRMSPEEARAEAVRRFGDVELARKSFHRSASRREARMQLTEMLATVAHDLRYAARGMRRNPGFAIAVMLTLALGIGANATMFGVIDRLMLRPPAGLRAPDEVHRVYLSNASVTRGLSLGSNQSYRRYVDMVQQTHTASHVAAHYEAEMVFGMGESARQERASLVSASFWPLFGVRPVLGRFFVEDEDRLPQGTPVAVLGYGYWQNQLGGARDVLGKGLRVGGIEYTIIGVAPERFNGFSLQTVAAYVPLTSGGADMFSEFGIGTRWYESYRVNWLETVIRRKPGVSVEAATADFANAFRRSLDVERTLEPASRRLVDSLPPRVALGSAIEQRGPERSQEATVSIWLAGVAVLVLLMACANVANLLVARALRRRREIAIRQAIGVTRIRLLMQLLSESTLLALLGGVAGVLVAQWGGGLLRTFLVPDVEWADRLVDGRVLLFTVVVALVAGLLTGLAPIRQLANADVSTALRSGGRGASLRSSALRRALLVVQGAVSVVLLIGAGLFVRSFHKVQTLDLGIQPDRVLAVTMTPRGTPIDSARREQLMERLRERALTVPSVEHAAATLTIPFSLEWTQPVIVPGIDSMQLRDMFYINRVGVDYFPTVGARLLRGRAVTDADRAGTEPVAILSQSGARRIWPDGDPIGKCVKVEADDPCHTVVGIVQDIRSDFQNATPNQIYLSMAQSPQPDSRLFVRTRGDAASAAESVRRALQELMPGAAVVNARPLEEIVAPRLRAWRLGATMFTIFGLLALVVAAVGLYSVVAYDVSQRTQELGVRLALGASAGGVLRLVVGEGMRVIAVGLLIGAAVSLALSSRMTPLLFQMSGRDPATFFGVAVVLLAVAVVASLAPAVRASRLDPTVALRAE